jgi:hypothetical protein
MKSCRVSQWVVAAAVVAASLAVRVFLVRNYWENPPIPEDPEDVATFKKDLAEFMAEGPPKLTQDQIDAFLQDGYLVWNNFAPKKLMNLLDKSNKMFHKYTWHANTFEDYTTKSYMGYLESEIFREWDLNGPLKHVTKQILDAHYNQTLSGVRLWNELILATTPSTSGIELHYDRGSYSHLADDAMGVSTWMLLADMDTKEYGQVLAPLNMTMISDECILEGQEGQNFRPHSPECRAATEAAVQYPDVQQGALILFSRWCYHRTAPRRASMPDGFERTLHVARWVHPDVEIKMYTQELDKTGGSRGGNKFAALALGARNYFCRTRTNRDTIPDWLGDVLYGSSSLTSANAPNFQFCAPDVYNGQMPGPGDVSFSYTWSEVLRDWPSYYFGEIYKNFKVGKYEQVRKNIKSFPLT